jgi:hypothetical protein
MRLRKTWTTGLKCLSTTLLVTLFYLNAHSQRRKLPYWELSTSALQFNYSGSIHQQGKGIMAEYYLGENLSVRGGLYAGTDYIKVSPAPLFWNALMEDNTNRSSHYHSSGSASRNSHPLKTLLLSLMLSDGFVYNIKVNDKFSLTPYVSPLQAHFYNAPGHSDFDNSVLTTSIGMGFKYYLGKNFLISAGTEYYRTYLFRDSGHGYGVNASIGYVFRKKR